MTEAATPPAALTDEEAVRRVREGETALFELLMRRYNQRLFRAAYAILRDAAEAEDAMQQAYVNAYAHLGQFEERARFSTWLTRILVNEALARVRRRGREEEVDAMPELEASAGTHGRKALTPEEQVASAEMRAILESSFEAIPEIYRSAFMLREVEGLSTSEAAECLGLSQDAVKMRLHRARSLLRQELFERAGLTAAELFPLHLAKCDRVVAAVLGRLDVALPPERACGCSGEYCHRAAEEPD